MRTWERLNKDSGSVFSALCTQHLPPQGECSVDYAPSRPVFSVWAHYLVDMKITNGLFLREGLARWLGVKVTATKTDDLNVLGTHIRERTPQVVLHPLFVCHQPCACMQTLNK